MFGSAIIDVAVGLIFVYLLLSLVCSALGEIVAQLLKLRSKTLAEGVQRILTDDAVRQKFYSHPLINSLSKKFGNNQLPSPSYIPSRNFALALLDVVAPAGEKIGEKPDPSDPKKELPVFADVHDFAQVREKITNLPEGEIRTALLALFDSSRDNLEQACKNVEAWFDAAMERVTGWYKRKSRVILIIVGFVLAFAMNADTIGIVSSLWKNPVLRQDIVVSVNRYLVTVDTAANSIGPADLKESLKQLQKRIDEMSELQLPLGWSMETLPKNANWFWKIVGLIFTSLAISLGAPFWFDLLNRITKLRLTGDVPKKSNAER
jgi:hypothetical protein